MEGGNTGLHGTRLDSTLVQFYYIIKHQTFYSRGTEEQVFYGSEAVTLERKKESLVTSFSSFEMPTISV